MKPKTTSLVLATLLLGLSPPAPAGPIGYLVGIDNREPTPSVCDLANAPHTALIQAPMFQPYDRDHIQWWYDLVEEAAFSNVSYIALGIRGNSACTADTPSSGGAPPSVVGNAVTALSVRGYQDILKLALFDDTAAYPGHLTICDGVLTFDLSNQSYWQRFFWDNNWKPYFQAVPDAYRMKISGRPVVFMWSVNNGDPNGSRFTNWAGNLGPLLHFLRGKCLTEFGFEPFIIVDNSWSQHDATLDSSPDRPEGENAWFGNGSIRYPYAGRNGVFTTGVATPGYWTANSDCTTNFIDRQGGATASNGLSNIASADIALLEGITDTSENAGWYRGSAICMPSCPTGTQCTRPTGQCWTNANQYLNVVRKFTAPFPQFIVYQAEAADQFYTVNATGSGLYRRGDPLNIQYTDSSQSDWSVVLNPSEWLQFTSFELGASPDYRAGVRYSSARGATARLLVDGIVASYAGLPSTGSNSQYVKYTVPAGFSVSQGNHDVRLVLDTGTAQVDNWVLNGFSTGPTCPAVTPVADFVATPSNPQVGETVSFTNASTGCPSTVAWDFGDGFTSSSVNTSHGYSSGGNFSVRLTVTSASGSNAVTKTVTVIGPPVVSAITPASGTGSGGGAVTVAGQGFQSGAVVSLGGVGATNVTVVSATQITGTAGAHAAGVVSVSVTNPDGRTGTLASAYTYVALSSVSLTSSSVGGGNGVAGTVSLTALAPPGGAVVLLSSSNPAVASVPGSVTVSGGSAATFAVATQVVSSATQLTITASYGGVVGQVFLTVQPPAYGGYHDSSSCEMSFGWGWDANLPNTPIQVSIYDQFGYNYRWLGTVWANGFRQDLLNAGIGNGYHAFSFTHPPIVMDGLTHWIYVYAGNTLLGTSPRSFTCPVSAHVIWIQPQATAGFGPPGSLVLAGSASGAQSGTQVYLYWRNVTQGTGWTLAPYAPLPDGSGIWYNSIENANASQQYEVFVAYAAVTSGTCLYSGNGGLNWCP